MATTATALDTEVPIEQDAGSLPRKQSTPSESSSKKDVDKKGVSSTATPTYVQDYDEHLPRYVGTFEAGHEFYTPIDKYEGKHRYDAEFEWEPKEERKLVRKV